MIISYKQAGFEKYIDNSSVTKRYFHILALKLDLELYYLLFCFFPPEGFSNEIFYKKLAVRHFLWLKRTV